ncbi:hypothetical protein PVAP13_3KG576300 [Panicum virgatum]|uniref:Uncharacterized protein n=1 Tax=Panicum virgatum TaxID=38727 RepID=A0A8T0VE56_PANVG|nr:hypothetical protein PVAP13_3KG576300 [Panicum virgatum]
MTGFPPPPPAYCEPALAAQSNCPRPPTTSRRRRGRSQGHHSRPSTPTNWRMDPLSRLAVRGRKKTKSYRLYGTCGGALAVTGGSRAARGRNRRSARGRGQLSVRGQRAAHGTGVEGAGQCADGLFLPRRRKGCDRREGAGTKKQSGARHTCGGSRAVLSSPGSRVATIGREPGALGMERRAVLSSPGEGSRTRGRALRSAPRRGGVRRDAP